MTTISSATGVVLYHDYIQQATGHALGLEGAEEVARLYKGALSGATRALIKGDLRKFDATFGDHACQVTAYFVISAYLDGQLLAEAERLKQIINKADIETVIGPNLFISGKIAYLVGAYILHCGMNLSVSRMGAVALRVDPQPIRDRLSRKCPLGIVEGMIKIVKERMNRASVAYLQQIASVLPPQERVCLENRFVQPFTNKREETLLFTCAFYNLKAVLLNVVRRNIPIALVPYQQDEGILLTGTFPENGPVFVIEGYFHPEMSHEAVGEAIKAYGPVRFFLAKIAVYPQFIDQEEEQYAQNEDIAHLPDMQRQEIEQYREEGRRLNGAELFRVTHIYAKVRKNL